jgi:hypothetical protein
VEPPSPTRSVEGGLSGFYDVTLASQPIGTVQISIRGDNQVQVSPGLLTFTASSWNHPQRVTVIAEDDEVVEGDHTGIVRHTALGPGYTGLAIPVVTIQISDNDSLALLVNESSGQTTVEEGGLSDTYTVVLDARPSEPVFVQITGENGLIPSPTQLTFMPTNWQSPQTVTVGVVADSTVEGTHHGSLTHTATGPGFSDAVLAVVLVTIADDDRFESISLAVGLNLVGWFGEPTTSGEILDSHPDISLIWALEPETGAWVLDSMELPAALRTAIDISRGRGFLVWATRKTALQILVTPL